MFQTLIFFNEEILAHLLFPEYCFMAQDKGECDDYQARFFYDHTTGVCDQFLYSGCGGNQNRFRSSTECDSKCGDAQGELLELCAKCD